MAGGPHLTRRLAALAAAVLLAHGLVLHWLAQHYVQSEVLRPMVAPLYTRMLEPQPVAPPPSAPKPAVARVQRSQAATVSIAPSVPEPTPTAVAEPSTPQPAATDSMVATPDPTPAPTATVTESVTANLDSWPADTRLTYELSGRFRSGDLYGDARVQWQREGSRYQVRVDVDVTLLATLVMTSQGKVTLDGLAPQVYEEQRRGRSRGLRMGEAEVLLANGKVLRRPPGLQDTASQFVELSHRFASGREVLEVGREVSFWMARPGAVDLWTYDVVEREILKTPKLGEVEAFHLKPRPIANPRGNITAEMWFAPSLQYLPVRIRVNMGDEAQIDLLVETIEQR